MVFDLVNEEVKKDKRCYRSDSKDRLDGEGCTWNDIVQVFFHILLVPARQLKVLRAAVETFYTTGPLLGLNHTWGGFNFPHPKYLAPPIAMNRQLKIFFTFFQNLPTTRANYEFFGVIPEISITLSKFSNVFYHKFLNLREFVS